MAQSLQEVFQTLRKKKKKSEVRGTDEEIQELFAELQNRQWIRKCL